VSISGSGDPAAFELAEEPLEEDRVPPHLAEPRLGEARSCPLADECPMKRQKTL